MAEKPNPKSRRGKKTNQPEGSSKPPAVEDLGNGSVRIDGKVYTLGAGSAEEIQRAIANGTFSGFGNARKLKPPPW